jgi:hypothetical protein
MLSVTFFNCCNCVAMLSAVMLSVVAPTYYDRKMFQNSGPNVIKRFADLIYECDLVFVPCKPFQPSLMFVGKATSLTKSGATERCST